MESKTIQSRDPELEESFSLSSCHDFKYSSSSLTIFSNNDQTDHDDDESYIEIALEPGAYLGDDDTGGGNGGENCYDDEMELRISLSSGVFLPAETRTTEPYESVNSCTSSLSSSSSSVFTFSSSSTEAESPRNSQEEYKLSNSSLQKTIKSNAQFPAIDRYVNAFTYNIGESSEIDLRDGRSQDANRLDLVAVSKSTGNPLKITAPRTTVNNGTMTKVLTIFRPLKFRTLLASFLKASQAKSAVDKGKLRGETFWRYNQSLTKQTVEKCSVERKKGEKSTVIELNSDTARGVLEAMTMSIRSIGRRERRIKGCADSTTSSPIHQRFPAKSYKISSAAPDNSIQAAIAHCKRSFSPDV